MKNDGSAILAFAACGDGCHDRLCAGLVGRLRVPAAALRRRRANHLYAGGGAGVQPMLVVRGAGNQLLCAGLRHLCFAGRSRDRRLYGLLRAANILSAGRSKRGGDGLSSGGGIQSLHWFDTDGLSACDNVSAPMDLFALYKLPHRLRSDGLLSDVLFVGRCARRVGLHWMFDAGDGNDGYR